MSKKAAGTKKILSKTEAARAFAKSVNNGAASVSDAQKFDNAKAIPPAKPAVVPDALSSVKPAKVKPAARTAKVKKAGVKLQPYAPAIPKEKARSLVQGGVKAKKLSPEDVLRQTARVAGTTSKAKEIKVEYPYAIDVGQSGIRDYNVDSITDLRGLSIAEFVIVGSGKAAKVVTSNHKGGIKTASVKLTKELRKQLKSGVIRVEDFPLEAHLYL